MNPENIEATARCLAEAMVYSIKEWDSVPWDNMYTPQDISPLLDYWRSLDGVERAQEVILNTHLVQVIKHISPESISM